MTKLNVHDYKGFILMGICHEDDLPKFKKVPAYCISAFYDFSAADIKKKNIPKGINSMGEHLIKSFDYDWLVKHFKNDHK